MKRGMITLIDTVIQASIMFRKMKKENKKMSIIIEAKCTVRVSKLFFQNCTQPHEDRTYILSHINLYLQKTLKKKITGLRPARPPYGAAPLPPTKVGAKCLATVVLAHPDCALSLEQNTKNTYECDLKCVQIWKRREMRMHVQIHIRRN